MAYRNLLSSDAVLRTAMQMVEHGSERLSLRAVALTLGVKAPSLYRYFPQKEALEIAVSEEILNIMHGQLQLGCEANPDARFREVLNAYLRFARERSRLYSFLMQNHNPEVYGSHAGKAMWNLLLGAVSDVSGQADDTASTVATWSFLHGYATLEHAGAFGGSGPKGGLERGVEALLFSFRAREYSVLGETFGETKA